MKRALFALMATACWFSSPAIAADCSQTTFEVVTDPNRQYFVRHLTSDNNVEVFVNGRLIQVWRSTDVSKPEVNLSSLFLNKRANTVRIRGTNEKYLKGWHDPNPGDTGYDLSSVLWFRCTYPDWRGDEPQQMFDHTYTYIDQRYPGVAKVVRPRVKSDPRLVGQELRFAF